MRFSALEFFWGVGSYLGGFDQLGHGLPGCGLDGSGAQIPGLRWDVVGRGARGSETGRKSGLEAAGPAVRTPRSRDDSHHGVHRELGAGVLASLHDGRWESERGGPIDRVLQKELVINGTE